MEQLGNSYAREEENDCSLQLFQASLVFRPIQMGHSCEFGIAVHET